MGVAPFNNFYTNAKTYWGQKTNALCRPIKYSDLSSDQSIYLLFWFPKSLKSYLQINQKFTNIFYYKMEKGTL